MSDDRPVPFGGPAAVFFVEGARDS